MPKNTRSQRRKSEGVHEVLRIPDDLNDLYVGDLRSLCKKFGLKQDGGRQALVNRLQKAKENRSGPESVSASGGANTASSRHEPSQGQVLSDAQRQEILSLMQSSMGDVAEVAATRAIKSMHQLGLGRPIETETVREENASCGEGLLQAPNTLQQQQQQQQGARLAPSTSPQPQQLQQQTTPTTNSVVQALQPSLDAISQALQKLGTLPSVGLPQPLPGTSPHRAGPNRLPSSPPGFSTSEVPPKLVQEIIAGEFFDLAKLMNKNLLKLQHMHNGILDSNFELIVDPENKLLKAKPPRRLSITTLDEWTNALGTYISVIVSRFPNRAVELIDYMGIIREAAADFPGLGFLIYDYQFRMKAAADKFIYWGVIDSQLWLRIFSKHPSRLREAYRDILDVSSSESNSLFYQGPQFSRAVHQGDVQRCHSYNRGRGCVRNPCPYAHLCNRCSEEHPRYSCPKRAPACNRCGTSHNGPHCPTNHSQPKPNPEGRV